ncbi:MAG: hypothetical protein MSG77_01720 [Prevotella sp.]|nr:hypothetical protein [Prevotella sp.]
MEQDRIFIRHKTVKPAQEAAHCRGKQTRPAGLCRGHSGETLCGGYVATLRSAPASSETGKG